jgi:hypothetical protein
LKWTKKRGAAQFQKLVRPGSSEKAVNPTALTAIRVRNIRIQFISREGDR